MKEQNLDDNFQANLGRSDLTIVEGSHAERLFSARALPSSNIQPGDGELSSSKNDVTIDVVDDEEDIVKDITPSSVAVLPKMSFETGNALIPDKVTIRSLQSDAMTPRSGILPQLSLDLARPATVEMTKGHPVEHSAPLFLPGDQEPVKPGEPRDFTAPGSIREATPDSLQRPPVERLKQLVLPSFMRSIDLSLNQTGDSTMSAFLHHNTQFHKRYVHELAELVQRTNDDNAVRRYREVRFLSQVLSVSDMAEEIKGQRESGKCDQKTEAEFAHRLSELAGMLSINELPIGQPNTGKSPRLAADDIVGQAVLSFLEQTKKQGFDNEVGAALNSVQKNWNADVAGLQKAFRTAVAEGTMRNDRRCAISMLEQCPLAVEDRQLRTLMKSLKPIACLLNAQGEDNPARFRQTINDLLEMKASCPLATDALYGVETILGSTSPERLSKLTEQECKAISKLWQGNKELQENISVFQARALVQGLSNQSSFEQIEEVRKSLRKLPDSSFKKNWQDWSDTQVLLRDLRHPARAFETLESLSKMALAGNISAQQALRVLSVSADSNAETSWRKANDFEFLLPPSRIDLSGFNAKEAEQLRLQAFEHVCARALSNGLTSKDAELLAHISMGTDKKMQEAAKRFLNKTIGKDGELSAAAASTNFEALTRGYFTALTSTDIASPSRTLASEAYGQLSLIMQMEHPQKKTLDKLISESQRQARDGNDSAARFLSFLSSAPGDSIECSQNAADALKELAQSANNRPMVLRALSDTVLTGTFQDKGFRLSILADIVLAGETRSFNGYLTNPDFNERVRHTFLTGFNSDNPRAVEALFKIAPYWSKEHIDLLTRNICPATADAIARHARKVPQSLRSDLVFGMLETIERGGLDGATLESVTRGIRSFAPHLDESTILLLSSYSGKGGKEFFEQKLSPLERDKSKAATEAQARIADCLLTTAETSSDSKIRAYALHAFAGSDWGEFGRVSDRHNAARVAKLIRDNPGNWFIQSQLTKLVHDHPDFIKNDLNRSSWNTPEHRKSRLTAYWIGNGVAAESATKLMDRAIQNYGLEKVKAATENVALIRSLHPSILAAMGMSEIGSDQCKNIADVLHKLADGSADSSWTKQLLEPLDKKVEAFRERLGFEINADVRELNKGSQERALKSIEINAVRGVPFSAKVKEALGEQGLSKFRLKESALFDRLKGRYGEHELGVEKVAKLLEWQRNLEIACANHKFVQLMNDGEIGEADRHAKKAFAINGVFALSLAPDMQRELATTGEGIYKGTFGRMKEANAGLLDSIHHAHQPGTESGYRHSMQMLREFKVSDTDAGDPHKSIDAELFRKQALLGIQMHPVRRILTERSESVQKDVTALVSLMTLAETRADKMETFIEHMKTLKERIKASMKATPEERAILKELQTDLLDMLDPTKKNKYVEDPKTRELINQELKTITFMRGLLDPHGFPPPNEQRKAELTKHREKLRNELDRLLDPIASYDQKVPKGWYDTLNDWEKNSDWDKTGPWEWSKEPSNLKNEDGMLKAYWVQREIGRLSIELGKVNFELEPLEGKTQMHQLYSAFNKLDERKFNEISDFNKWAREEALPMLMAFVAGAAVFLSCSNPVTAVIVAPVAAIAAGELTKEIQHNLGLRSDGSILGDYSLRDKPVKSLSGRERPMEFGRDVLLPYGLEYVQSAAMGAGGAVLGSVAGTGLARTFQSLRGLARSDTATLAAFVRNSNKAIYATSESAIASRVFSRAIVGVEQSGFFTASTIAGELHNDHHRAKSDKLVREHDQLFSFFKDAALIAFLHAGKASFKGCHPMPVGFNLAAGEAIRVDRPVMRLEFDAQSQKAADAYKVDATKRGSTIIEHPDQRGGFVEVTDKGLHVWFEPKPAESRIGRPGTEPAGDHRHPSATLSDISPDSSLMQRPRLDDLAHNHGRLSVGNVHVDISLEHNRQVRIGSDRTSNDLVVDDNSNVSTNHATIRTTDSGLVYITDNGSTQGSYINRKKLEPGVETLVRPNDIVAVGPHQLTLFHNELPATPTRPRGTLKPLTRTNQTVPGSVSSIPNQLTTPGTNTTIGRLDRSTQTEPNGGEPLRPQPLPERPVVDPSRPTFAELLETRQWLVEQTVLKAAELEIAKRNARSANPGASPKNTNVPLPEIELLNTREHAKVVKLEQEFLQLRDYQKKIEMAMWHTKGNMAPGQYMVKAANGEVTVKILEDARGDKAIPVEHFYELIDELLDVKPQQRDTLPAEIVIDRWDGKGEWEYGYYCEDLALLKLTILDADKMAEMPMRITLGHETGHAYHARIIARADESLIKKIEDKYAENLDTVVQDIARFERNISAENIAEIKAELLDKNTNYTNDKVNQHPARYCASIHEVIAELHMLYREQQRALAKGEQVSFKDLVGRFSPMRARILDQYEGMYDLLKKDVFPKLPISTPRVKIGPKAKISNS